MSYKTIVGGIVWAAVVGALAFAFAYGIDIAITKQDNHRCLVLYNQALHYPDYYLTKREADTCAKFGIYPNAPIK